VALLCLFESFGSAQNETPDNVGPDIDGPNCTGGICKTWQLMADQICTAWLWRTCVYDVMEIASCAVIGKGRVDLCAHNGAQRPHANRLNELLARLRDRTMNQQAVHQCRPVWVSKSHKRRRLRESYEAALSDCSVYKRYKTQQEHIISAFNVMLRNVFVSGHWVRCCHALHFSPRVICSVNARSYEIFKRWSFLRSKSVNNVCRVFQLASWLDLVYLVS